MKKHFEAGWQELRRQVLGLGRASTHKSHYASLRQKLVELERFRSVVDGSTDLLFVLELPSCVIIDLNQSACEQLGMRREALKGTSFNQMLPVSLSDEIPALARDFTAGVRDRCTLVTELTPSSGKQFPVEIGIRCSIAAGAAYAVLAARDITERKRAEQEIRSQRRAILELSTPVLPLANRILVVPLIGLLDSQRATQLSTELLARVRKHRAKAVVLDVTGAAFIETHAANSLVRTFEAVRLLGATTIVTGISMAAAYTLTSLGLDLAKIKTFGDLQSGVEEASYIVQRGLERSRGGALDRRAPTADRAGISDVDSKEGAA